MMNLNDDADERSDESSKSNSRDAKQDEGAGGHNDFNHREKDYTKIARFISEIGSLKNIPRSGWLKIGIKNPESVAEHSMRSAIIAFIITMLETGSFDKSVRSAFFSLIHDIHESRVTDLHKLSMKYIRVEDAKAKTEQRELLPDFIRRAIDERRYLECLPFIEDADKLELLFQSVEYTDVSSYATEYTKNIKFQTESARKIAESVKKIKPWWIYLE